MFILSLLCFHHPLLYLHLAYTRAHQRKPFHCNVDMLIPLSLIQLTHAHREHDTNAQLLTVISADQMQRVHRDDVHLDVHTSLLYHPCIPFLLLLSPPPLPFFISHFVFSLLISFCFLSSHFFPPFVRLLFSFLFHFAANFHQPCSLVDFRRMCLFHCLSAVISTALAHTCSH